VAFYQLKRLSAGL